MPISSKEYVDLVKQKPWNNIKEFFKDQEPANIKILKKIDINPEDWIQFSVDNIDMAQEKYEKPKEHYTEISNTLASINNQLGRDAGNTSEFNFGINGNTNQQLVELLGKDNIEKLGLYPDYILIRLIIKMPGHGIAWHIDDAGSYELKFPELTLDSEKRCQHGRAVRYWFPVADWEDGHAMQIDNTVITHWNPGDAYIIPWGHGHASSNFGYVPQYTVSLTGFIND
jgi:hypothetical protein